MSVNEAEKKLAQYRASKRREALFDQCKAKIMSWGPKQSEKKEELEEPLEVVPDEESSAPLTALNYVQYLLYFALWCTLWAIFIKLEFGAVFLLVSMLLAVYFNTGTSKKKKNVPSAYSVFNPNCQKIDGTLDGEQMTRQMLYGGFNT